MHFFKKTVFKSLAPIYLLAAILGCGGGGSDSEPEQEQATLSLSENSLQVSANIGESTEFQFIVYSSDTDWTVSIDSDWLEADVISGYDNAAIKLSVSNWALVDSGENNAVVTVTTSNSELSENLNFTLIAEPKRLFVSDSGIRPRINLVLFSLSQSKNKSSVLLL